MPQPRHVLLPSLTLLLILLAFPAHALTRVGALGGVKYAIYAPDWTWQDREVNILVVLQRLTDQATDVSVTLVFPPGKDKDFAYKGKTQIDATLSDPASVRKAFVGIKPLGSAPRQVYPFEIRVRVGADEAAVEYPLRTIRGAAVSPGKWAILLPVIVALIWCGVFLVALQRMAPSARWWKRAEPINFLEAEPSE